MTTNQWFAAAYTTELGEKEKNEKSLELKSQQFPLCCLLHPVELLLRNIIYIFIFSDIDECETKSLHRCNQICNNTLGSYSCSCEKGFEINRDGYTCEGMKAVCYFNLAVLTLIYSNFTPSTEDINRRISLTEFALDW